MPDTNGGCMLTAFEAQLANRPAVSPADRMYTPAILPPGRPEPPRRTVAARESTLYPLLARLPRNGFVGTSWRGADAGPPRRYYRLPREGELALARFQKQWRVFGDAVNEQRSQESLPENPPARPTSSSGAIWGSWTQRCRGSTPSRG